jgi:hypothetical protein
VLWGAASRRNAAPLTADRYEKRKLNYTAVGRCTQVHRAHREGPTGRIFSMDTGDDMGGMQMNESAIDEVNLVYVAATRAKRQLLLNPDLTRFMQGDNRLSQVTAPVCAGCSLHVNSRTQVPQKLTGLISLYTSPISIFSVPIQTVP